MYIHYPDSIVLGGGSYRLRSPDYADVARYFTYIAQDEQVTRYLHWPGTDDISEIYDWIAQIRTDNTTGKTGRVWFISDLAQQDAFIGTIALRVKNATSMEFGCSLAQAYWGRGIMTLAVQALIEFARTIPQWYRLSALCDVDNLASAAVWRKCGFSCEGVLKQYQVIPRQSAIPRDLYLFSYLLQTE